VLSAASRDNSSPACWPLRAWVLVTLCWMSPPVQSVAAEAASKAVGPRGSVVATDLSPAMLERARERLGAARNVSLAVEDGQSLSFPDQQFDAVLCAMGTYAVSGSDARPRGVPGTHGGPWRSFRAVGFAASTQRRPPRAQEIPEKEVIGVSRGSRAVPSSKLIRWRQPAHGDQARGARPVNCTEPFA
jgi:SAM-dependent methyltransferase